jgi:hypothetical protein
MMANGSSESCGTDTALARAEIQRALQEDHDGSHR